MGKQPIFVNTCVYGAKKFPLVRDYIEEYGADIGFEILSMFDLADFEPNLKASLDILEQQAISFHGPVFCAEHSAPKGSPEYEETMWHIGKTLEYARPLKSRHLTMHLNNCAVRPEDKDVMLKNALENYKELEELFGAFGCQILVENTGTLAQGNVLLDQGEFTDLCRREKFAVLIDIGHAHANGWDLPRLICDLAGQVAAFHLHNNDGCHDLHNRLHDGTLDFASTLGLIRQKAPGAELIIEYTRPALEGAPLREDIAEMLALRGSSMGELQ